MYIIVGRMGVMSIYLIMIQQQVVILISYYKDHTDNVQETPECIVLHSSPSSSLQLHQCHPTYVHH